MSQPVYRAAYQPFPFIVEQLDLSFQLHPERTEVTAQATYRRNRKINGEIVPLQLDGEGLHLLTVQLDGKTLAADQFQVGPTGLTLPDPPDHFQLTVVTEIHPEANTALEGLYRSSGIYCSQCEAEGFRKITYYPDRPDVLSRFTTRIEADRNTCPVLLANGNLLDSGLLPSGRHYVVWGDPHPKPCYLFAVVAGQLLAITDAFVSRSGRSISLQIFVEPGNEEKCRHAMAALKEAMRWDEEVYGLEYDLDIYMIVAVHDFNMGAMENKGLNIFNAKYVLASPETATDQDYLGIEGVIAHEYFHNWTGNRVTCRDWFQLSLKEGLTVFRDQQFSADQNSRPVERIGAVRVLKNVQFREDAGPLAHPIRPDSYVQINNFYTATVYNKGAEVIRMLHTLLGREAFRRGMDLYFARHDGQAVTCDDFVAAMSDAGGLSLEQFRLWYSQAGTPQLLVREEWQGGEYRLRIAQSCQATPGQPEKKPFHLPLAVGLLGQDGRDLLDGDPQGTRILHLTEEEQLFHFAGLAERPVLSFLRDFSAPVRVARFQSPADLAHLLRHDSNLYNRWESGQQLATTVILAKAGGSAVEWRDAEDIFRQALADNLRDTITDPALLALTLQLPAETTLAQELAVVDPEALHNARKGLKKTIAKDNYDSLLRVYLKFSKPDAYRIDPESMGRRSLKNTVLDLLLSLEPLPDEILELVERQYSQSGNMTDTVAALAGLVNLDMPQRGLILADFYQKWKKEPLVLDKWFALQAAAELPDTLARVVELTADPAFSMANPNRVRALIGTFAAANHLRFHQAGGAGYRFLADKVVALNGVNPQIAARLVVPLTTWRRYDRQRQLAMVAELQRIAATAELSRDVEEIVSKSLPPGPGID